ncbi:hypothetical protein QR680_005774 [Steinernema hermaphroditum]|uniref:BPTI/Kunitz inhibitor domain-containing protein n=1 Tax=Steinernema hermaphroditum TaxID=289476 RepID=A0AA39HVK2_9BILA|nr:hypothetical protein QR680_005774 [Steinernema hermaphroditum]
MQFYFLLCLLLYAMRSTQTTTSAPSIELYIPRNDPIKEEDLARLRAIYYVIIVPPPLEQSPKESILASDPRFLSAGHYRIHFSLLCADGVPLLMENDLPKPCSPRAKTGFDACPSSFWCHVGLPNTTNYCCPRNKEGDNPCMLPAAKGFGKATLQRFFFDSLTKSCIEMEYTGFGGNENNFLSKAECEGRCRRPDDQVNIPTIYVHTDELPIVPIFKPVTQAPAFSPKVETTTPTAAPPKPVNPCNHPPDKGIASDPQIARSIRFYYDLAASHCVQFTYLGSGGNMNNFETEHLCMETCGTGGPEVANCLFTLALGNGGYRIPRYFYNVENKKCEKFYYTGSGGNRNRFASRSACIELCIKGVTPPPPTPLVEVTQPTVALEEPEDALESGVKYTHNVHSVRLATNGSVIPSTVVLTPSDQRYPMAMAYPAPAALTIQMGPTTTQVYPTLVHIELEPVQTTTPVAIVINPNGSDVHPMSFGRHSAPSRMPNTVQIAHGGFSRVDGSALGQMYPISPCRRPSFSGIYVQNCAASGGSGCPQGFFCQFGASFEQSVCCPVLGGNPCVQPKSSGVGLSAVGRWYYDAATNHCKTFLFHGFQGNQNNFMSFEQCQKTCGAINPCLQGQPLIQNDVNHRCSPNRPSCPANYYCHMGADSLDTVCCPVPLMATVVDKETKPLAGMSFRRHSPCSMNVAVGSGSKVLHRWAYSPVQQACVTFVYTGAAGNQNNFLTRNDCVNSCVAKMNPCGAGNPLMVNNDFAQCDRNGVTGCPASHFCHIGATTDTTVCCPRTGTNRCHLTLATGGGSAILHRYYFDAATSTCRAFTYTGMGGNENNFLTLQECRKTCPEFDNPCVGGAPPINPIDGSVGFCSAANPSCPKGFFCHVGDSRQTTVCCPRVGSQCDTPMALGTGSAQLPRFYYNSQRRACETFLYTGKGGNQNNFLTKAECENACPVLDNPCSGGFPALRKDSGDPVFCSTARSDICPAGFFCHIGATVATTLCCPGAGDPCRMPMAKGNGHAVMNRWYFNSESRVCVSFVYSGRGGNHNNFMSRSQCTKACPEYRSPCPGGQPHIGLSGQITHCGATGPSICPTTFWCHVGATLDTSVCCPGAADPCDQPLTRGSGTSQLLRFYYNRDSRSCQQFQYTGLGGNENNFLTLKACEERCPVFVNPCAMGTPQMDDWTPVACSAADPSVCGPKFFCHIGATEETTICCPGRVDDVCNEPRIAGTGDASLPRFAFNPLTRQCLPFLYTGVGGNQNNFLSKASCEHACPVLQNPCSGGEPATNTNGHYVSCSSSQPNVCPSGYWCHVGSDVTASVCCPGAENPCALPASPGTGKAAISRWYFDSNLRRCTRFTYSGKGGNQNNFLTLQECQLRCPEFQNPCATGDPAQAPSGGILFCSAERQICPSSYWCHLGASADASVCCPSLGDPCLSAMTPGTGHAKLPRWYFNQNTRQCLQFTYTGSGGNANNFLAEAACVAKCPVFRNPCPNAVGGGLFTVTRCSAQNPFACPAGHWCHIGGTSETSVCCPGASDPCSLPLQQGVPGNAGPYTRWYFDTTTRICRAFQYSGFEGNENNFLTREDCAQRCPEFVNPCYSGDPFRETLTGLVRFCQANSGFDCPPSFYCHLGADAQTTVCCPGSRDPCTSPLSIGSGTANLPRWYFNTQSRRCQQFVYTGIGGNNNNFLSREACTATCPEFSNPCGHGAPLTSVGGSITYCTAQNPHICPQGYFCHVGSTQESTVCCPGTMNPCLLPMDVGRGSASLTRFYFNQLTRRCEQFAYSGEGGNANNFIVVEACRQACPEYNNPCAAGEPYRPVGGGVAFCSASSPCPPNYYCHFGADSASTLCCPAGGQASPCMMPVVIGSGGSQMDRFYFNVALQQCVPFIYSGLGGNQNNFVTVHQCASSCMNGFQMQNSFAPLCTGPGCRPMHSMPRMAVHRSQSLSTSTRLCPKGEPLVSSSGAPVSCTPNQSSGCPREGYVCNVMSSGDAFCCPDPRSFCLQPRNPGSCPPGGSMTTVFGYNPTSDTCEQFLFTGCGGNLNQFKTAGECNNICCNKGYNLLLRFNDVDENSDPEASNSSWVEDTSSEWNSTTSDLITEILNAANSTREPKKKVVKTRRKSWTDWFSFWK